MHENGRYLHSSVCFWTSAADANVHLQPLEAKWQVLPLLTPNVVGGVSIILGHGFGATSRSALDNAGMTFASF